MLSKLLAKPLLMALAFAAIFAVTPSSAKAQHGGGGGGGGGHDLPSLEAIFQATSDDDPDAYGEAVAIPNPGGDGQSSSLEIHDVFSVSRVSVYINGAFLAYVDIDANGDGGNMYTIGYYGTNPVNLPIIHAGDEIDVYDDDGTMLLTGTFQ